jgi:hypothetical protein
MPLFGLPVVPDIISERRFVFPHLMHLSGLAGTFQIDLTFMFSGISFIKYVSGFYVLNGRCVRLLVIERTRRVTYFVDFNPVLVGKVRSAFCLF